MMTEKELLKERKEIIANIINLAIDEINLSGLPAFHGEPPNVDIDVKNRKELEKKLYRIIWGTKYIMRLK